MSQGITLDDRRDRKILTQGAKYKRLTDHPMKERMSEANRSRLQRSSFVHKYRTLTTEWPELDQEPEMIPRVQHIQAWNIKNSACIKTEIQGIGPKNSQLPIERKIIRQAWLFSLMLYQFCKA